MSTLVNIELARIFEKAIAGKIGREAIFALSQAYRDYALSHPGLYQVSVLFPEQDSKEWTSTFLHLREIFVRMIKSGYDLSEGDVLSVGRALRSMLHGFISLELSGGWTQIIDIEESFKKSLELVVLGVEAKTRNR